MTPKPQTVNFILMNGGVGDHVGSLVALDYIAKKYPWIKQLVWVPDYFLDFSKHLLRAHPQLGIFNYSSMKDWYNPNLPTKTTKWDQVISPMKIHTVDYAFLKLCDENPEDHYKQFLKIKEFPLTIDFPKDYAVITTGFTAEVREWPAVEVNKIIEYLLANKITPVFLGQTQTQTGSRHIIKGTFKDEIHYEKGINLIDQTNLLEAAQIMSNGRVVMGVDNGLLHVAACTKAPIIAGYTTVSPNIRRPYEPIHMSGSSRYRVVEPDMRLECQFCQEKTNFLFGHDYRNCLKAGTEQELLCTKQMTANKFITHIKDLLNLTS